VKKRLALAAAAAGAAAALVWWRRRRGAAARPGVQIGLADGAVHTLGSSDGGASELESLALDVRRALQAGA